MKEYFCGFFKLLGYGLLFLIAAVLIASAIVLCGLTVQAFGYAVIALVGGDFLTFFKDLATGLGIILFFYTIAFFFNKWIL